MASGVGHTQVTSSSVLDDKVLVFEGASVNRLSTCAISMRKITSLSHEVRDDPMEKAVLVAQFLATSALASLSCAQSPEVLGCFGSLVGE